MSWRRVKGVPVCLIYLQQHPYYVLFELLETLLDNGVLVSKGVKNKRALALETCVE